MAASFFFYDLETSGFNPRAQRIMQFAGQRTDLELRPVGEPVDTLLKLTDDSLPDVDAVLITGLTPQQTIADGVTEAEFLRQFENEVAVADTIFVGFNSIRFDDEFMRYLRYRNFYDPYEWQWQEGRSRWDLLDVVRMTRALRPGGITWPFDIHGKPTNRLELLTGLNNLEHDNAHNALSDVTATIAVARLIRNQQTKLFEYLLGMRDKKKVAALAATGEPFVYTSGKYPSEFEKTTVVVPICAHPKKQGALVYDLRHDPGDWVDLTPEQLAKAWQWAKEPAAPRLPVKTLQFNRCPAVAPLSVLDAASRERLGLDMAVIRRHAATLAAAQDLPEKLRQALAILDTQQQTSLMSSEYDVDAHLYDGFLGDEDRQALRVVRAAAPEELGDLGLHFNDHRLEALLPLYKARNYPKSLTAEERDQWEQFRTRKLLAGGQHSQLARYFERLQAVAGSPGLTPHQEFLLEELKLYAESIVPSVPGAE